MWQCPCPQAGVPPHSPSPVSQPAQTTPIRHAQWLVHPNQKAHSMTSISPLEFHRLLLDALMSMNNKDATEDFLVRCRRFQGSRKSPDPNSADSPRPTPTSCRAQIPGDARGSVGSRPRQPPRCHSKRPTLDEVDWPPYPGGQGPVRPKRQAASERIGVGTRAAALSRHAPGTAFTT